MSIKEKSIKGFLWDFSGRLGLQSVGFVVSIILARLLSPGEFGLLAIVTVFINLATVFLDFGFSSALIQKSELREEHYSAVFYLNLSMGFLLSTIVFFLAPLVGKYYNNNVLINVTRLMSAGILISSFGQIMRTRLRREMNFRPISISNIFAALGSGFVAIFLAWKGYGVWSLAIQTVLVHLLSIVMLYLYTKQKISYKLNWTALKELWPFSSRLFFSGLLDTIFFNIDALIIAKLLSPITLGYYHRAKSLENFGFRYTASTLASVLFPGLSSLQNDPLKFKAAILKIFDFLSFVSFIACGLLLVGSRELILIVFSVKWEPSVIMFQLLIIGAFASQIYSLIYNVMLSTGNSQIYLYTNIIYKILLLLNFLSIYYTNEINIYLVGFTIIGIFNFLLGLKIISKRFELKKQLYFETVKNLISYALSISITLMLKHEISLGNLYLNLVITWLVFLIMFITVYYILNREKLISILTEFRSLYNIVVT
jgi:O-antigen/teichoic acid export membrane protein